jgi:hypothetical protein
VTKRYTAELNPPEGTTRRTDMSKPQDEVVQANVKKLSRLFAQVWIDEDLKQRLVAQPRVVLEEYGVEVSPNLDIRVVENTEQAAHVENVAFLILPPKPVGDVSELTSGQLDSVAGGVDGALTSLASSALTTYMTNGGLRCCMSYENALLTS